MTDQAIIIILAACMTASGWLLGKWLNSPRPEPNWRKRSGLGALFLGAVSSALLSLDYVYAWVFHALLTHGLASYAYSFVGLALSALGVILGSIAAGYLRLSALLISLVAALEWSREFAAVAETRSAIDVATLAVIGVLAIACLGRRWYSGAGADHA